MGEFKAAATGDGSWARPPDEEKQVSSAPPGPFMVTDMPAIPLPPAPKTEKTRRLLGGVAPADGEEEL